MSDDPFAASSSQSTRWNAFQGAGGGDGLDSTSLVPFEPTRLVDVLDRLWQEWTRHLVSLLNSATDKILRAQKWLLLAP